MPTNCDRPSLSRYKDARIRCRCDGCRAANQRYMRRYRRYRLLVREAVLVSADDARRHIETRRLAGVTFREIAEAADVPLMTIYRLARGQVHCQPEVCRRVLAS